MMTPKEPRFGNRSTLLVLVSPPCRTGPKTVRGATSKPAETGPACKTKIHEELIGKPRSEWSSWTTNRISFQVGYPNTFTTTISCTSLSCARASPRGRLVLGKLGVFLFSSNNSRRSPSGSLGDCMFRLTGHLGLALQLESTVYTQSQLRPGSSALQGQSLPKRGGVCCWKGHWARGCLSE